MNIKKIILFQGGVETLDYFSRQMGDYYESCGYNVFYVDLQDLKRSARLVRKFIRTGETILITFNFEGLEREEELYTHEQGYLWRQFQMPCFNIIVDHPYFYHNRFMDLLEDENTWPGFLKNYHHISIDRKHQDYVRTYYPEFHEAGFLPLAGTNPKEAEPLKAMQDRTIDIVFTGNYTVPSRLESHINWINEEYANFYIGIIEDLLAHPNQTVDEAEVGHCEQEMGYNLPLDLRMALHKMMFIDLYVRNEYRGRVVAELVNAGFSVTVIGKGWEDLDVKQPNRMTILDQTDSLSCLYAIRDAKLSLNVMPWFKDGAHDRVFNSILNGAVCVSDGSKYLEEQLQDGEGIIYYSLTDIRHLPEQVSELLSNVRQLDKISEDGLAAVRGKHTWKCRAEQLLQLAFSYV